jgi:hypothetical protein
MKTLPLLLSLLIQSLFAEESYPIFVQLVGKSVLIVKGEVAFLMGEIGKDETFDYAIQIKIMKVYKGEGPQINETISMSYEGITNSEGESINAPVKGRTFIFFLRKEVLVDPFNPENPLIKWHPIDRLFGTLEAAESVEKQLHQIIEGKDNKNP